MGCCQKKKSEKLLEQPLNKNKDEILNVDDSISKAEGDNNINELDSHNLNIKLTYDDFIPLKLLGRGSFGEVLLVKLKVTNKLYAMKVLNKNLLKIKKQQTHTKTERDLMVKINSPFIVNIKSAFQDQTKLYIVTEFMQGGDMFFHMHDSHEPFKTDRVKFYVMELVLALDFLHKNNMVYRDLKPENILLDTKGHIKLTDFGLSKILETEDDKAYTICGTPQYLAPEVILKKGYDKAVDWWSLGCVMYEMLTGKLPFPIKKGTKLSRRIYQQQVDFPKKIDNNAKDLMQKLLIVDPNARLGSGPEGGEKIKNHPFFKGINWKNVQDRKIKPPFIPKLKKETDLKYFDTMFTDEEIGKENTKIAFRDREASNEYNGFSYVTGSVNKELLNFVRNASDSE